MGTSKAVSLGLPLLKQLKQLLTSLGLRNSQIIKCKEKISFNPFHDFHESNFQDKKLPGLAVLPWARAARCPKERSSQSRRP